MAKKSRKRAARFEKNQSGCMRGLISMFDFRHVHTTQKLLPDRKRGSRRVTGASYKLETLEDSGNICKDINDGEQSESATVDAGKMSVKELMEEDMIGEEDQKKQAAGSERDPNQTMTVHGGHTRKSRWRASKKSFDLGEASLFADEELVSEKPVHRKHKSSKSLDLGVMMEEFCNQIHEKKVHCFKHDQESGLQTQSKQDSSDLEQKLGEATKVFVDHYTDEKSLRKDAKIQPSKELLEALEVLNLNKEVFLKLLQDPNSQLTKHMKKFQDSQVERDRKSKEFSEEDLGDGKHESFFWRTFKGLERSFSKRNDDPHDLNRIVVLKPGPPDSHNLETATTHDSSLLHSPQGTGNNVSLNFSFAEFKRRLKHVMRKEQPNARDIDKANKTVRGENGGMPSPGRDHFFMERIPKLASSIKKGDKIVKAKERKVQMDHDTSFPTDQRVSGIYVEAKKQLAEIVGNNDADVDFLIRKVPKSLGRILAFPGYSSPVCSPRKDGDLSFTSTPSRLSPRGECLAGPENGLNQVQEINVAHQSSMKQVAEDKSCIIAEKLDNKVAVPDSDKDASDEHALECDKRLDSDLNSVGDDMNSEVDMKVAKSSDDVVQEQGNNLDISSGRCSLLMTTDDALESCEEKEQSTCLELVTGEDELSSPPMTSLSEYWHGKDVEDLDITDRACQPSPISVLDPIFRGDDISPSGFKSLPVGEPIRPHRIQFEDQSSPPPHIVAYIKTCGEDKKSIFEFIQVVVQKSGLTWDEVFRRLVLSDHMLDPALFDEVESLQDRLCEDPKLLFDLIDEVLSETCWQNFGSILSYAKPFVRPEVKGKDLIAEIWEIVDWYFQQQGPRSLDEIVSNDCSKSQRWMDWRPDTESLGIEMEEAILEGLMEDTILNFIDESQDSEIPAFPADLKETMSKVES